MSERNGNMKVDTEKLIYGAKRVAYFLLEILFMVLALEVLFKLTWLNYAISIALFVYFIDDVVGYLLSFEFEYMLQPTKLRKAKVILIEVIALLIMFTLPIFAIGHYYLDEG